MLFRSKQFYPDTTGATIYAAAGTYSYTVPPTVTSISVKTIGAGGGGAAGNDGGYSHFGYAGSGGGSGYESTTSLSVTPGETITVFV